MKNPNSKRNTINMIFSSFLVIGFIICTYFFSSLASRIMSIWGTVIQVLIMVIFGLLLFYATRVGDGRQVRRFSPIVLILIDIPSLYIILASLFDVLPLHAVLVQNGSLMMSLACVALGYGIPYTFFAGYEMKDEDEEEAVEAEVVEGGLAEELAAAEAEEEAEELAEDAEEAVEEAEAEAVEEAEETAKEATEEAAEETEELTEAVTEAAEEAADEKTAVIEEVKEEV